MGRQRKLRRRQSLLSHGRAPRGSYLDALSLRDRALVEAWVLYHLHQQARLGPGARRSWSAFVDGGDSTLAILTPTGWSLRPGGQPFQHRLSATRAAHLIASTLLGDRRT